jgi:hypothetical protein
MIYLFFIVNISFNSIIKLLNFIEFFILFLCRYFIFLDPFDKQKKKKPIYFKVLLY